MMMELYHVRISLNQIIAADLFLGYNVTCWDPRTNYFLLGEYKKTSIFNVNCTYVQTKKFISITLNLLIKKCRFWLVHERFRFFSSSPQFLSLVSAFPELFFVSDKWDKGSLTNFKFVKFLKPKKFPHGIFCPNILNNYYVINECYALNIPSFSIVDSYDNPFNVFFPIPGGSRNVRSMLYFYMLITRTVVYSRTINSSAFLFSIFSRFRKKFSKYNKFLNKRNVVRLRPNLLRSFKMWRFEDWFSSRRMKFLNDNNVVSIQIAANNFFRRSLLKPFLKVNPVSISERIFFVSSILIYSNRLFRYLSKLLKIKIKKSSKLLLSSIWAACNW